MVEATLALIIVMTKTPRKLKNAAMRIAAFGPMALVETQVAMALGASVQPLTRITPRVSTTVTARTGLERSCDRKEEKLIVISLPFLNMFQT